MDGFKVKEVMEQVHIPLEMQEEIIANLHKRMEQGNRKGRGWNLRKITAAAVLVAMVSVISFPALAFVANTVRQRMEGIPKEELKSLNDMVQSQQILADGFSREYSANGKERSRALWQAYENGTFPEKAIAEVDREEAVAEGTLCYIRSTGVFHLPSREMTDEEMLEIIDFQHKMSYAIEQSGVVTEEEKAAYRAEKERLEKIVQDANGISKDQAVEIAKKKLKAELGEKADRMELMTDRQGNGATLMAVSELSETVTLGSRASVLYDVGFGDPNDKSFTYGYWIDAVDGSNLYTYK